MSPFLPTGLETTQTDKNHAALLFPDNAPQERRAGNSLDHSIVRKRLCKCLQPYLCAPDRGQNLLFSCYLYNYSVQFNETHPTRFLSPWFHISGCGKPWETCHSSSWFHQWAFGQTVCFVGRRWLRGVKFSIQPQRSFPLIPFCEVQWLWMNGGFKNGGPSNHCFPYIKGPFSDNIRIPQ